MSLCGPGVEFDGGVQTLHRPGLARLMGVFGVATRNGCKAAVHATRAYIEQCEASESSRVLVKLDISNAFNTVRRDAMLETVKTRAPEIYSFVWQDNDNAAPLFIGDSKILSQAGARRSFEFPAVLSDSGSCRQSSKDRNEHLVPG